MARLDATGTYSTDGKENPVISWQISGLGNPFTTEYYRSVGISTQAAVSGASSVSGILDQVNAGTAESSSYIASEVVCASGTYTVYGWARALNGLYYPIQVNSPVTVTVPQPIQHHSISSLSVAVTETTAVLTARVVVGGFSGYSCDMYLTVTVNGKQYTGASVAGTYGNTVTLSVTVTGLAAGTTYSYRIMAEGGQNAYWSDDISGTFTTEAAIPEFEITNITDTSVTVYFSNLTIGDTIKGDVKLGVTSVSSGSFTAAASTATRTYSGLSPETTYKFYMYQNGTQIDYWPFKTLASPKFSVDGVTESSVTVSMDNLTVGSTIQWRIKIGSTLVTSGSFTAASSSITETFGGLDVGTTYTFYLYQDGAEIGSQSFTTAIVWSLVSSALGTLSDAYSVEYSFGKYVLRRFSVKFERSGTATFYTTGDADTMGYLGTTTGYNNSTGIPTDYIASDDEGGSDNNFSITYDVVAGTTYYLWVRLWNGAGTGSACVCINPPKPVYYAVLNFDPNGGTGGPSTITGCGVDTTLVSITLPTETPSRENYKFLYWLYGGAAFYPGTTYLFTGTESGAVYTLTAVWELAAVDRIGSGGQYKRGIFWIGHGGKWCKAKRWIGDGGAWKQ